MTMQSVTGRGSRLVADALDRLDPVRRRLRWHFMFEVGGKRIAYCYIRKNACSAFKRLILDLSNYDGEWSDAIHFLTETRAAPDLAAVESADWRIFVYRDPFERTASLFRNKLVMESEAADFLDSFVRIAKCDPENATFAEFVSSYLGHRRIDPHAQTQASHLLPVSYNCVSTLETLQRDAERIFGRDLADKYFSRPSNASSSKFFDEPSSHVPVGVLRKRYRATGELPSATSLSTPEIQRRIRSVYSDDYELGAKLDLLTA